MWNRQMTKTRFIFKWFGNIIDCSSLSSISKYTHSNHKYRRYLSNILKRLDLISKVESNNRRMRAERDGQGRVGCIRWDCIMLWEKCIEINWVAGFWWDGLSYWNPGWWAYIFYLSDSRLWSSQSGRSNCLVPAI